MFSLRSGFSVLQRWLSHNLVKSPWYLYWTYHLEVMFRVLDSNWLQTAPFCRGFPSRFHVIYKLTEPYIKVQCHWINTLCHVFWFGNVTQSIRFPFASDNFLSFTQCIIQRMMKAAAGQIREVLLRWALVCHRFTLLVLQGREHCFTNRVICWCLLKFTVNQ